MRRAGVVGDPAGHSLSPAIHRAGYEATGLDWSYDAYTVAADDFDSFVGQRSQDPAWAGLSVTAPHKEAALRFGAASEDARLVGGANTIVFGERPSVHNTDVPGFVGAWRAHSLPTPRSAAVLGNGATARSIVVSLARLGVADLVVLARRPERATDLVVLAERVGVRVAVERLGEAIGQVDVVASTIPAEAAAAHAVALAETATTVFDVVYDPWPTPLTEAAAARGRMVLNGLDLLAGQAVDQFRLLTGRQITFEQARSAAGRELKRRAAL